MQDTPRLTCISVVFFTSISAGESSCAPALSAAKAWWDVDVARAGEKAMSKAAAVLTTVLRRLSPLGNGDAPMRKHDDECRDAQALLLLLRAVVTCKAATGKHFRCDKIMFR